MASPRQLPSETSPHRYVFIVRPPRPQCPSCRSTRLWTYKTLPAESDGTRSRYTRCLVCGVRFILVVEVEGPEGE